MPRSTANTGTIISASAPVGPDAFESLSAELTAAINSSASAITVDLSEAQTIDAACLSLVIAATRGLSDGRTLAVKASPSLNHAFTGWRLDTILELVGDESSA